MSEDNREKIEIDLSSIPINEESIKLNFCETVANFAGIPTTPTAIENMKNEMLKIISNNILSLEYDGNILISAKLENKINKIIN